MRHPRSYPAYSMASMRFSVDSESDGLTGSQPRARLARFDGGRRAFRLVGCGALLACRGWFGNSPSRTNRVVAFVVINASSTTPHPILPGRATVELLDMNDHDRVQLRALLLQQRSHP